MPENRPSEADKYFQLAKSRKHKGSLLQRRYLQKAAHLGHSEALLELGKISEFGENIRKNLKKAKYFYEKASFRGVCNAHYQLASMYLDGIGLFKNHRKAFYWMKKQLNKVIRMLTLVWE